MFMKAEYGRTMLTVTSRANHVVVIGGGFSGTMQAVNLLRHDVPSVTLIEPTARLARGVAYSTGSDEHLLNVRRGNMSAYPDDPEHFDQWASTHFSGIVGKFVPRRVYGHYLQDQLTAAAASAPDRLNVVRASAVSLDASGGDLVLGLADGSSITADRAVLALGNLPPHPLPGLKEDELGTDRYVADPWQGELAAGLSDGDEVLIVGSGLTMIDAVLLLRSQGFAGRISVLSRRGLVPHVHGETVQPVVFPERPVGDLSSLVRFIRAACEQQGWQAVIDGLRPYTRDMWLAADLAEQSRFLRHLRAWWDIHRHRIAPQIAAKIAEMRDDGRLTIAAGKTIAFKPVAGGMEVTWRPRGTEDLRTEIFRRIINCTGPQGDVLKSANPLLRDLRAKGLIRPDRHHMGIDVTAQCEVIDGEGRADQRILALGPMTRGTFWEVVAVPDIRMQTWNVARRIANAHWVGGEGL